MKEKESETSSPGALRKETWIRPDGGRRVHRTTSAVQEQRKIDSEEEDLAGLSSIEVSSFVNSSTTAVVNKRFLETHLEAAVISIR